MPGHTDHNSALQVLTIKRNTTDGCDCYRQHTLVQFRHNSLHQLGRDMTHPKYAHEANLDGGSGIHHIPKGSADSHAGK